MKKRHFGTEISGDVANHNWTIVYWVFVQSSFFLGDLTILRIDRPAFAPSASNIMTVKILLLCVFSGGVNLAHGLDLDHQTMAQPSPEGSYLNCAYKYYGVDFAQVKVYVFPNGTPDSSAQVTQFGRTQKQSLTVQPASAGETFHLWLSKDNPEGAIEMIVFTDSRSQGNSVLINANMPVGREIWGSCP